MMKPILTVAAVLALASQSHAAMPPPPKLMLDADGTVHADALTVPLSDFLSPEAKRQLNKRLHDAPLPSVNDGIAAARKASSDQQTEVLNKWLAIYPLDIRPEVIGGVQTDVVTPKGGVAAENKDRVLINLHVGGFWMGARTGGQAEAAPLAGRGRIKVVAIDYRMAPEFVFPAASQDVEAVYKELLKTYKPQNIGIYGCSAGGTLTGEATALIEKDKLPRPGAIGIFCSGLMPSFWFGGDSFIIAPMLNGTPPPDKAMFGNSNPVRFYFAGIDLKDPMVTPGLYPEVLAKFPPTLIVTGTRDLAESNALVTHMRMLKAGVDAQLLVLEGFGHGHFDSFGGSPESADAYDVIWGFFDKHLGR